MRLARFALVRLSPSCPLADGRTNHYGGDRHHGAIPEAPSRRRHPGSAVLRFVLNDIREDAPDGRRIASRCLPDRLRGNWSHADPVIPLLATIAQTVRLSLRAGGG